MSRLSRRARPRGLHYGGGGSVQEQAQTGPDDVDQQHDHTDGTGELDFGSRTFSAGATRLSPRDSGPSGSGHPGPRVPGFTRNPPPAASRNPPVANRNPPAGTRDTRNLPVANRDRGTGFPRNLGLPGPRDPGPPGPLFPGLPDPYAPGPASGPGPAATRGPAAAPAPRDTGSGFSPGPGLPGPATSPSAHDPAFDEDEYEDLDDESDDLGPDELTGLDELTGPEGPTATGGAGREAKRVRRRRGKHVLMTSLAIFVAAILVAAFLGARWAHGMIDPSGKSGPKVAVTIPKHASLASIGQRLASRKVITSATLFPYYAKLEGGSRLLPGTYHLAKHSSYNKVLAVLEAGPPIIRDILVIPEGFTLAQIAARIGSLPKLHLSAQKVLAASSSGKVRSPYEPADKNDLEGLVFPATYEVTSGESEVEILRQMVQAFDQRADEVKLAAGAQALHLTPYQVVTIASMVEREAKLQADRGPIASVIYNRLRINMPLQIDSTLMYGLGATNPNDMNLNSTNPYNTYRYKGLPPTPIASPGLPSLEAALHPPKTSYLYYAVVQSDGKSAFASTYAAFQRIEALCRERRLC